MRCIVIADTHGRPELIKNVIRHSNYDKQYDRLIHAGDFIDIGSDPIGCWKLLDNYNAEMLWGNHDLAILLKRYISLQDSYSHDLYHEIFKRQNEFKVAANHNNVLITHAGLSSNFLSHGLTIEQITDTLNHMNLRDMWCDDSPLWFRPRNQLPYPEIIQVCGHTPPEWADITENYYMVDPYISKGFDKPNRYRYAIIKNEIVTIIDSEK